MYGVYGNERGLFFRLQPPRLALALASLCMYCQRSVLPPSLFLLWGFKG